MSYLKIPMGDVINIDSKQGIGTQLMAPGIGARFGLTTAPPTAPAPVACATGTQLLLDKCVPVAQYATLYTQYQAQGKDLTGFAPPPPPPPPTPTSTFWDQWGTPILVGAGALLFWQMMKKPGAPVAL